MLYCTFSCSSPQKHHNCDNTRIAKIINKQCSMHMSYLFKLQRDCKKKLTKRAARRTSLNISSLRKPRIPSSSDPVCFNAAENNWSKKYMIVSYKLTIIRIDVRFEYSVAYHAIIVTRCPIAKIYRTQVNLIDLRGLAKNTWSSVLLIQNCFHRRVQPFLI